MKLYVVRHGQTAGNITEVLQGEMDLVLNETGRNQAKNLKEELKGIKYDLIISSPKLRALETAVIINSNNIKIITDSRLRSRNHGEFEGLTRSDINISEYWNYNKNIKYERAENIRDLYNRVVSFINDIKIKYKGLDILISTHSGICRIIYYYFNGIPSDGDLNTYESHTCSFEIYELED